MKCREFEELFSDYLEGTLNQTAQEELEVHLKVCSGCSLKLQGMKEVMGKLKSLATVEPSQMFETKIWSQLGREPLKRRPRWFPSPVPVLVAVLICLAAGSFLLFGSPHQRESRISQADIVRIRPLSDQTKREGDRFLLGYQHGEAGVSLERFTPPVDSLHEEKTRYILPSISKRPRVEFTSF